VIADAIRISSATTAQGTIVHNVFADHLDTPRLVTTSADTPVKRWEWNNDDPFGGNAPNENPAGAGTYTLNFRLPGQYSDAETGLHYNMARDYDPIIDRYIQSDPVGLASGTNSYVYGLNNALTFVDPSGLACLAAGGWVTCTPPNGPTVSFPQPPGWPPVINANTPNYHYYNIPVQLGCANPESAMQGVINLPTPGTPQPAIAKGTLNNATPTTIQTVADLIDRISSFGNDPGNYNNSPVTSYLVQSPGGNVVVNVTMPGHPLFPGYVARTISAGAINNFGEGAGWLQGPKSPFASQINNIWKGQSQGIVDNSAQRCECRR
jgi:RHS repeat-associated protein